MHRLPVFLVVRMDVQTREFAIERIATVPDELRAMQIINQWNKLSFTEDTGRWVYWMEGQEGTTPGPETH